MILAYEYDLWSKLKRQDKHNEYLLNNMPNLGELIFELAEPAKQNARKRHAAMPKVPERSQADVEEQVEEKRKTLAPPKSAGGSQARLPKRDPTSGLDLNYTVVIEVFSNCN